MFEPKSYWEAKHDEAKRYIASLEKSLEKVAKRFVDELAEQDQEIETLGRQNEILHQALKAIATPQEYKLIMQEVEKVFQKTEGNDE